MAFPYAKLERHRLPTRPWLGNQGVEALPRNRNDAHLSALALFAAPLAAASFCTRLDSRGEFRANVR